MAPKLQGSKNRGSFRARSYNNELASCANKCLCESEAIRMIAVATLACRHLACVAHLRRLPIWIMSKGSQNIQIVL